MGLPESEVYFYIDKILLGFSSFRNPDYDYIKSFITSDTSLDQNESLLTLICVIYSVVFFIFNNF